MFWAYFWSEIPPGPGLGIACEAPTFERPVPQAMWNHACLFIIGVPVFGLPLACCRQLLVSGCCCLLGTICRPLGGECLLSTVYKSLLRIWAYEPWRSACAFFHSKWDLWRRRYSAMLPSYAGTSPQYVQFI